MISFHFKYWLRKLNYRINHTEGQAETSLQVLHACMNIFHFLLAQYVTMAVWQKRRKRKTWRWRGRKKKSTFRDWCTTDVTTTQLGDKITETCKEKEGSGGERKVWKRKCTCVCVCVCVCLCGIGEEKYSFCNTGHIFHFIHRHSSQTLVSLWGIMF